MKTRGSDRIDPEARIAVLWAAATSSVPGVTEAILRYMRQGYNVTVVAMGPQAVNQAAKAIAAARRESGRDLVTEMFMGSFEQDGERKTALHLRVRDLSGDV